MAKLATAPGSFEQKLRKALREGLSAAGLDAEIGVEPIRGTKLRRVHVTSAAFEKLRPSERQDLVWRIVSFNFPQEDQLKISMILTLSPRELQGK
jgi:tRNA(Ser,Leu) C12 N-acetylase TAN1